MVCFVLLVLFCFVKKLVLSNHDLFSIFTRVAPCISALVFVYQPLLYNSGNLYVDIIVSLHRLSIFKSLPFHSLFLFNLDHLFLPMFMCLTMYSIQTTFPSLQNCPAFHSFTRIPCRCFIHCIVN